MLEHRGQIGAIDVFGNDIAGELVGGAGVMHGHDVGMIEIGDRAIATGAHLLDRDSRDADLAGQDRFQIREES